MDELFYKEQQVIFDVIAHHGHLHTVDRGQYLYYEGDSCSQIFAIKSGLVGLYKVTMEGKDILLRVFGEGFFFGHRSFLDGGTYHASAQTLTNSEIYKISTDRFVSILQEEHHGLLVMKILSKELGHCENRFVNTQEKDTLHRVVESLIFLKCRDSDYNWTRKEIADFCGLTMESVIRVLSRLQKDGFIKKEGRLLKLELSQENLCKYGITAFNKFMDSQESCESKPTELLSD